MSFVASIVCIHVMKLSSQFFDRLVHATKSPLVEAILKVLEDCAPFVVCPSQASTWVNKGGGCSAQSTNLVTFESRGARDLALKQNGAEIPGSSSRMRIKVLVPIPSEVGECFIVDCRL